MFNRPDQQRDLRYAGYAAALMFFYLLAIYIGNQRLLAFWIGFLVAAPTFVVSYLVLRITRLVGRLTGLNEPVLRVRDRVRGRIEEVVEELEEEIEESP